MQTALVYSDRYLKHNFGRRHPERPERLKAIVEGLKKAGYWLPTVRVIEPTPAEREEIELAHDPEYVSLVERLSKREEPLDIDTPTRKNSFELALLAAGGAIGAGRAVLSGEAANAFALVRPAGHHASHARGGGFCFFNNLAIATKSVGVRTLILDIDCHAGNGTMDIFWESDSVLYLSLHQWPLYPGVGWWNEIGGGAGEGFTINLPLYPDTGDDVYLHFLDTFLLPLIKQFKPELIAVSVGFDAHWSDPLTQMNLSLNAYYQIGKLLSRFRTFAVLEGGYNLEALSGGVVAFLAGLRNEPFDTREKSTVTRDDIKEKSMKRLEEIKKFFSQYWKL